MPVDPIVLLAFIPAALALNLTPGADMMFCLGQGLRNGPRAAMAANLGIGIGGLIQAIIAGLGLGAAIAAVPWMFDVIRCPLMCLIMRLYSCSEIDHLNRRWFLFFILLMNVNGLWSV